MSYVILLDQWEICGKDLQCFGESFNIIYANLLLNCFENTIFICCVVFIAYSWHEQCKIRLCMHLLYRPQG